jgi:teichuronic acid biosynthesis glycosyltransferase TuaH
MKLQDRILFLGRKAYEELPHFLAEADVGVLTYRPEQFVQYASSLKVFEYMAAGLPVIGTHVGEWAKIIEKSQAGLLIDFTPKAFAEATIELLHSSTRYKEYAQNAVSCARTYDWSQVFAPMLQLMNS